MITPVITLCDAKLHKKLLNLAEFFVILCITLFYSFQNKVITPVISLCNAKLHKKLLNLAEFFVIQLYDKFRLKLHTTFLKVNQYNQLRRVSLKIDRF